ncbi:hypothetical protein EDC56_2660 [Sinobacterium caligoides]|uniref:Uncharacterized protein n=1 Tax=Sinobacterium caligoides TaxID=933926 RepID=A0A3N2DJR8_9GAMM|nr:hypothetical protein [Sinobacterium caligoides]ROS00026.1 hypothetical protein EDC56_2660 [Sinobacterium caligoides]
MPNSLPYRLVTCVEQFILHNQQAGGVFLLKQDLDCEAIGFCAPVVAVVSFEVGSCRIGLAEYNAVKISAESGFEEALHELGGVEVDFSEPLKLSPRYIAKPWGQEIWYTGVERRGVCGFVQKGGELPIPWLLSLFPAKFSCQSQLVLLKILDPLPTPVFGDLYFELHEKKQEVYVVTHVDGAAWPDGVGGINLGFSESVLAKHDNEQSFKDFFAAVVRDYRAVRRSIDVLVDGMRREEGVDLNAPVGAKTLRRWLSLLPRELVCEEAEARRKMNECIAVKPLSLGDVVKIPCLVPHALQHGVRTVEFQTPVYERLIVSFAQKVLTQEQWDSKRAIELMRLQADDSHDFSEYCFSKGPKGEVIVDFDDFFVVRVKFEANESVVLENDRRYVIVMAVAGDLMLGNLLLKHEEAALSVATTSSTVIKSLKGSVSALICLPKPHK